MSEPGDSSLQFAKQLFYHQGEQIRIDIRSSNEAFSSFRDYLTANEIQCGVFTWA